MRVFIILLVLIFSLQSLTKADDISDFEIEGMSIGDSLLDFFSEDEILKSIRPNQYAGSDGKFVEIDGSYIIVGAPDSDSKGAAYIFVRSGTNWSQQAKLVSSDLATSDGFGYDVSISGDYAIVGAPIDDHPATGGNTEGSAYIFVRSGTNWSQQAKLVASDAASGDWFGMGVGIDGDYAVVGCWQCHTNSTANTGAAYTFIRSGTSWSQQAKLVASDAAANDDGGRNVAISGDYALISANGKSTGTGAAYLYKRSGTSWSQAQKLTASDAANNDNFSFGLDLDGGDGIIGASGNDDGGGGSGSAYVFREPLKITVKTCGGKGGVGFQ